MKVLSRVMVLCILLLLSLPAGAAGNGQARLEWNRKTLTEDYLRVGKRNPKWDSNATNALNAFAKMRATGTVTDTNVWNQFYESVRAAIKARCDDPLIRYLHARAVENDGEQDPKAFANEQRFAAHAILNSGYSHVRRFYACIRAAAALKGTVPSGKPYPADVHGRI